VGVVALLLVLLLRAVVLVPSCCVVVVPAFPVAVPALLPQQPQRAPWEE
jgi:hypothetical protein